MDRCVTSEYSQLECVARQLEVELNAANARIAELEKDKAYLEDENSELARMVRHAEESE
jgi:hypothetical protein